MKKCKICKITKDEKEFYKDKRNKDGLTANCGDCSNKKEKARGNTVAPPSEKKCSKCGEIKNIDEFTINNWRRDGRESKCRDCKYFDQRAYQVQRYYGLTPEKYQYMISSQNNKCAICGRSPKTKALSVDHCHKTDKVRGLLCWPCNRFLGHIGDDTDLLKNMIDYLESS